VVGSKIHRHESGIHVSGQTRDRLAFQPFVPESVGQSPERLQLGWHSGRGAVRHQLAEMGLHAGEGIVAEVLESVRRLSARQKREVFPEELEEIALRHGAVRWRLPSVAPARRTEAQAAAAV
jgi:isopropylmalate/homocitrate/citramalate synthase